ncbi:MAG TPA: oligoribonuclease [Steroidobacteraceae bacterium]|jgi:oligoribonuclease|nr:oligoribonuclease [Steroidobacteraceae bacterium]
MLNHEHLIWIDLEMTGLLPQSDQIIEIATVVTDKHLNIIAEGPEFVIHQPDEVLARMDAWNQRQHSNSGLVGRVRSSRMTAAEAERQTLLFLSMHVPPGVSPMCGNSICQDRRFLARLMPELERFFHYRNLDVSTLKELARRWMPSVLNGLQKQSAHQARADINESISELRHYRQHMFVNPS